VSEKWRQKTGRPPRAGTPVTRLQTFLDAHGFTSAQLEGATGISRQSMTKIRAGRDVRRKTMLKILQGLRSLTKRRVAMDEVFELDQAEPAT